MDNVLSSTPTADGGNRGQSEVPGAQHRQQFMHPADGVLRSEGWQQISAHLGEFQTAMQDMQRPIVQDGSPPSAQPIHEEFKQHYYAGGADISALYGGQTPTPECFDHSQYLPMNANFYMPPGAGLPYMDPYGLMNPAALPPLTAPVLPKKATSKKSRSPCC